MTMYTHVRNKDDILDAIGDAALGSVKLRHREPLDIESAISEVAWAFLDVMRNNPVVMHLISSRMNHGIEAQRGAMESALRHLAAAGLPDEMCMRVYGVLFIYALGFSSYQRPRPWAIDDSPNSQEQMRQLGHFYAGLPSDEFPTTVQLSDQLPRLAQDETFWYGVDALIARTKADLENL